MHVYRRRLPHRNAPGTPAFETWRLRGSLPKERVFVAEHLTSGEAFAAWDRLLDTARSGPQYLRQSEIATLVQDQLLQVETDGLCTLHAYVIMPNHVHVLWTPRIELPILLRRVKGSTAFRANKLLRRTGPFWREEYFDRLVRDDTECQQIRRYTEWNRVHAALAPCPEDFPWSSAYDVAERG